ncbi:hypothetical protein [Paracoccus marcusii]|uniref:hypothetical protein n=1 Tax=Paracoccus marcusii TaxID=59779 RepID=UPI003267ADA8
MARLLATDRITLTANLKLLERRGLLMVIPDAEDRRSSGLTLIASGLALLERAIPIWTASHGDIEMTDSGDFGHLGRQLDVLASS